MRFQGLDLNLLLALDRLLRDRSVSVAAKNLNLSQSALSHALNRLRDHFGDALFISAGRKLLLTPLAEALVVPMRDALMQIEAVVSHTPRFEPSTTRRHFKVMASDYCIVVALANAISVVRQLSPDLTLELAYPDDPLARLEHGEVDIVILPLQYMAPNHPTAQLFEDEYVIAVWSQSLLAEEVVDSDCYFKCGHIAARWGLGRQAEYAEGVTLGAPRLRRVELTAPSFTIVPRLLQGTELIATVPKRLAQMAAKSLPLTLKPLPFASPKICEYVQWNACRQGDPAILWLLAALQDACR